MGGGGARFLDHDVNPPPGRHGSRLLRPFGADRLLAFAEASPQAGAGGHSGSAVDDDVHQLARASGKTAEDLGHATVEAANKAGQQVGDAAKKAGAGGEDAWLTTKVKAELARESSIRCGSTSTRSARS